jgi:histone H3/H4
MCRRISKSFDFARETPMNHAKIARGEKHIQPNFSAPTESAEIGFIRNVRLVYPPCSVRPSPGASREALRALADSELDLSREYTVRELLRKIDPSATIDSFAEEFVLDLVGEFIDSVAELAADCAQNRCGDRVGLEDVDSVVQGKFRDIGLGTSSGFQLLPEFAGNEAYMRRLKAVEKARKRAEGVSMPE